MCGDHYFVTLTVDGLKGSPPHVRGPHFPSIIYMFVYGITPACAGTTYSYIPLVKLIRDHPRMCGDHLQLHSTCKTYPGSPPHVRGPLFRPLLYFFWPGITPACAGTTSTQKHCTRSAWDHPRMCGDHSMRYMQNRCLKGSPPHVRGPLVGKCPSCKWNGITPACAGTTLSRVYSRLVNRDHPRMCGDHICLFIGMTLIVGSPPHVRGPLTAIDISDKTMTITPACAGTTSCSSSSKNIEWDHPRMCGDHHLLGTLKS